MPRPHLPAPALLGTIPLLATMALLPAPLTAQQPSDELASYRRAHEIVRTGMQALGGDSTWAATDRLMLRFEGELVNRHQSHRVDPPYDRTPLQGWAAYDNPGRRFAFDQSYSYPGGFDGHLRLATDGRSAYRADMIRRTAEPAANAGTAQFNAFLERMPQAVVRRALDRAASLRYAGTRTHDGRPHELVRFAAENGTVVTLAFDASSHLLSRFELLVPDVTEGEAVSAVEFDEYHRVGPLMIPGTRTVTTAGEPIAVVRYAASLDAPLPDSLFAMPSGVVLDTVVVSPRAITPRTLAPGVHAIHGVAGNTVLAIEFADHLMVLEPPGSDAASRAVMDTLARLVPGKPVRYVVATHFHDDHTGGVRAYMDAGATVVTTPAYVSYFERVARRAGSFGTQEMPIAAPKIETVEGGRRVFEDGTRRVELIDIGRNPHTDEMLVAWLPAERFLFQGDLWNAPWSSTGAPRAANATTRYFLDWLERSGLEPQTIVGVHGPVQTLEQVETAAE